MVFSEGFEALGVEEHCAKEIKIKAKEIGFRAETIFMISKYVVELDYGFFMISECIVFPENFCLPISNSKNILKSEIKVQIGYL